MSEEKLQLFYEVTTFREYGYDHTRFTIRDGRLATLDSLIERCVDNQIGYYDNPSDGSTGLETAAKMTRRYEWLKSQGYSAIHAPHYGDRAILTLTWLHTESGYCEAEVGLPRNLNPVRASVKILDQLVKSIERHGVLPWKVMQCPSYVLGALIRKRAIGIGRVTIPQSVHSTTWDYELCVLPTGSVANIKVAS